MVKFHGNTMVKFHGKTMVNFMVKPWFYHGTFPPQSQPLHPRELRAKNGGGAVRDHDCEFMMYGSGSVEALFSPQ